MFKRFLSILRGLRQETLMLYYAVRDPRTPWYAQAFVALIVAYAFSPIDLIPDFIPILGFVDEMILLPLAISLALRMLPAPVIADARRQAEASTRKKPRILMGALIIVLIWIVLLGLLGLLIYRMLRT